MLRNETLPQNKIESRKFKLKFKIFRPGVALHTSYPSTGNAIQVRIAWTTGRREGDSWESEAIWGYNVNSRSTSVAYEF